MPSSSSSSSSFSSLVHSTTPVRGPIYPRARPSRMVSSAMDPHLSTRIIVRYRFNPPPGIALLRDPLYIYVYICQLPLFPLRPVRWNWEIPAISSALIRFVYQAIGSRLEFEYVFIGKRREEWRWKLLFFSFFLSFFFFIREILSQNNLERENYRSISPERITPYLCLNKIYRSRQIGSSSKPSFPQNLRLQ